ncbi:MAG: mechanosensitive ion channel family protein [Chitinophagaceae bacterium]|nr:mechanosensitive ion channel family protein [Chitinophagaceae bacterium]
MEKCKVSEGKRRLDIEIKLSYGVDIAQAKRALSESIHSAKEILTEPTAHIGISALEPDRYMMMVNVWVDAHRFYDTRLV